MLAPKRVIPALALGAVACGDSPTAPRREITLYFCGVEWAAYRNEGGSWTTLPSTEAAVTFAATDRLAIATVSDVPPQLTISYLTADQAKETFVCGAPPASLPPTKQLNGSVAGVTSDASVVISTPVGAASATATSPTFQVLAPRDGPTDLVATSSTSSSTSLPLIRVNKAIIRRGETYADGATMPVLDFSSSEAFDPQSNTITLQGARYQTEPTSLSGTTNFTTRGGASELMKYELAQGGTVMTMNSVPASHLVDGDLHRGEVWSPDWRFLFFYRTPTDRTLSAGPDALPPVFTRPSMTTDHWVRIDVPAQPADYGEQIGLRLTAPQSSTSISTISIGATKEYFGGTPTTWSMVLPNLSGVSGFSPTWGLSPDGYSWRLTVSGIPRRLPSTSARDGDIYRSTSLVGFVRVGQ